MTGAESLRALTAATIANTGGFVREDARHLAEMGRPDLAAALEAAAAIIEHVVAAICDAPPGRRLH